MKQYILKTKSDGTVITVRDVQNILLEMAKVVDQICVRHNIPYFLNGGSALGAVRHQGFIPWDDDYDIAMMYDDYKKFMRVLAKELPEDYTFHCFDTHKQYNVSIPAMKIRKKGTYIKEANTLLANRIKDSDGLFVDVFVYDYVNKNKLLDLPLRLLNMAILPFIILLDNLHINPVFLKRWYVSNARLYGALNRNSDYVGFDLTWSYKNPLKPFIFKKSDIYPVKYVPFEDTKLPIANQEHEFLCMAIAPSYMTLPRVQEPKHIVDIDLGGSQ